MIQRILYIGDRLFSLGQPDRWTARGKEDREGKKKKKKGGGSLISYTKVLYMTASGRCVGSPLPIHEKKKKKEVAAN